MVKTQETVIKRKKKMDIEGSLAISMIRSNIQTKGHPKRQNQRKRAGRKSANKYVLK